MHFRKTNQAGCAGNQSLNQFCGVGEASFLG
jgi:hypothetical protein